MCLGTAHEGTATWGAEDCEPHSGIRISGAGTRMFIRQDDGDPRVHRRLETTALRPRRWHEAHDVGTRGRKSMKTLHVLVSCFRSRVIRMVTKTLVAVKETKATWCAWEWRPVASTHASLHRLTCIVSKAEGVRVVCSGILNHGLRRRLSPTHKKINHCAELMLSFI